MKARAYMKPGSSTSSHVSRAWRPSSRRRIDYALATVEPRAIHLLTSFLRTWDVLARPNESVLKLLSNRLSFLEVLWIEVFFSTRNDMSSQHVNRTFASSSVLLSVPKLLNASRVTAKVLSPVIISTVLSRRPLNISTSPKCFCDFG